MYDYSPVEDLQQFLYFHIFGLGMTLINEKWHLENLLARSGLYQSIRVQKIIKSFPSN